VLEVSASQRERRSKRRRSNELSKPADGTGERQSWVAGACHDDLDDRPYGISIEGYRCTIDSHSVKSSINLQNTQRVKTKSPEQCAPPEYAAKEDEAAPHVSRLNKRHQDSLRPQRRLRVPTTASASVEAGSV
jgi:hypothetical protein